MNGEYMSAHSKMKNFPLYTIIFLLIAGTGQAQLRWVNVDSLFQPLPSSVHVYRTTDPLDGKPNIAYYVEADLRDRSLEFTTDTTLHRRLTPAAFYAKNGNPLLVINCTFFSFATQQNLNLLMRNGRLLGYNVHTINGRGRDTFTYRHPLGSALGISRNRKADIAWLYTDSTLRYPLAYQSPVPAGKDSSLLFNRVAAVRMIQDSWPEGVKKRLRFQAWKMNTAVGGGPVLVQNGKLKISNNEELKFSGKAINDKHPRTAMGYTSGDKLILLVVEGRNPGKAEGATLTQLAALCRDLGCEEALNLDGGGSSCLLINGKETIRVSDAAGQRPVPGVFIIQEKK